MLLSGVGTTLQVYRIEWPIECSCVHRSCSRSCAKPSHSYKLTHARRHTPPPLQERRWCAKAATDNDGDFTEVPVNVDIARTRARASHRARTSSCVRLIQSAHVTVRRLALDASTVRGWSRKVLKCSRLSCQTRCVDSSVYDSASVCSW